MDLGILKISRSLSDLTNHEKKPAQRLSNHKSSMNAYVLEPRRSSRARNPIQSYCEEIDVRLPPLRKRSKSNSSWTSYLARPLNEVKTASYEERERAIRTAEEIQSSLNFENPSFVKSMVRSHVYSCFWLGLPLKFCEEHLPRDGINLMVLEDESGREYEATYISKRTGLSGGWRAFALDHKLDDGDALVFELYQPTSFKVYIVKASKPSRGEDDANVEAKALKAGTTKGPKAKHLNMTSVTKQKQISNSRKRGTVDDESGSEQDNESIGSLKDTKYADHKHHRECRSITCIGNSSSHKIQEKRGRTKGKAKR